MAQNSLILITILVSFTVATASRHISATNSSTNLVSEVSDGVHYGHKGILTLSSSTNELELCDQTYGFMPCTTSVLGNLFLISVYGYLMFLAATYLSTGSELMLEILGPGIVGGLFLPILGALPDALLILVSGLSGSPETAQDQVSVGMGLLAGSTVMLLTVIWGSCIIIGKCDLQDSFAIDNQDTKGFNLVGSGVSTDIWTSYSAMTMAVSVLPFIVVQFPQILHSTSGRQLTVLIGLIISISLLIAYCIYQVYQPNIQKRRLAFAKHKHVRSGILRYLKTNAFGGLLDDQGQLNREVLYKLFNSVDVNGDGHLSQVELRSLVVGMQLNINLNEDDTIYKVMKEFDTSGDDEVDFEEFITGIGNWLEEARLTKTHSPIAGPDTTNYIHDYYEETKREHYLLGDEGGEDEEHEEGDRDPHQTTIKAVLFLLLGTLVAAIFADPLVDAVDGFSTATSIPSFFISFIVLPLVTNSSESVSAIIFASRKKQRSASLTFSELYGAATMNNLLCLSVFLALVYARGLTWDFTSEVLVILIVCIVMGVFGSLRTTFPLWTSLIAFVLYPLSLVLVYILDYVFGWS
ncbi:putative EF-hand domain, sodium/calcium exchanger membrane region, EF-hand domain pair [Helianthus annuus]|uniref:Putative calcium-binding EF-hand family protein n=1 Tax=Helianthus annuus TaxID=4232 RepID=A0A251T2L0_HELAN|nr:sodium/calcium exchanger NCL [Helianthus annuus]KAF5778280.1 putative serine/threonine-protein phosphatase with EF-hands [Helianthus annuus]KAJ0493638.1 putative EF-hand domain, sodium/calcium exchanger membrane region, EF-hand domain pair [Helianthus annuus]KAJ0678585.1 putative EF-hand domain, calcium/proton exchanger, sodium/calcium exchanger membrane region [Helianthus annuus]KAJ0866894.1 putative EF-hand domain, sodium/calcium exchanger membrane region, EF-hand domain pair [Helianthus a